MSIFNKLFGDSDKIDKKSEINKPDLDKLLDSEDKNKSIIELDDYIRKLTDLNEEQNNFYLNQEFEREVNSDGFYGYFYYSYGEFAHETIRSLMAIGAIKTANLLQEAIDQFPDKTVPKDIDKRQETMEQFEEIMNENWDVILDKFLLYEDDLNSLNLEYVRQNKDKF